MAVRGNQFKTNTFRDKGAENAPGRSSSGRQPKGKMDFLPSFDLADGRAVKIIGLFFVILSLYFLFIPGDNNSIFNLIPFYYIYIFLIYAADPAKAPGLRRSACARTMITLDVCACMPCSPPLRHCPVY